MLNVLKKDLYILYHKKIFMATLIILTLLISYICLHDINNAYKCGKSYQHFFTIVFDPAKQSILTAFFYIIPLLVVLPFSDTWINEVKMTDIIFTRIQRYKFFISKYIISFLSGFLILFIPLMIAYIAEIVTLDFNDNVLNILAYSIPEHSIASMARNYAFYELYVQHPYVYIIMFNLIISMFGGLYAISAFSISLLVNNKVIPYIAVFFFSVISLLLISFLPTQFGYYSIQRISQPFTNFDIPMIIYIVWFLFFIICNGIIYLIYLRRDPFGEE